MIKNGDADGQVAGALNTTGNVLRAAFQVIKTKPGINVVSGAFVMVLPEGSAYGTNGLLIFADCAVIPDPTAAELAQIAVSAAQTARDIAGMEPRVAILSFSTKGSAKHEKVDKVIEATKIAKEMAPHTPARRRAPGRRRPRAQRRQQQGSPQRHRRSCQRARIPKP